MLIEERCYVLHSDRTCAEYLEIFHREGLDLQRNILGGLLGYFVTEVGELNAIVSLWEYPSFEERHRRRADLARSPQWQGYLTKVRPMIKSMNNRIMTRVV